MSIYRDPEPWPSYLDYPFTIGGKPARIEEEASLWQVLAEGVALAGEDCRDYDLSSFRGEAAAALAKLIRHDHGEALDSALGALTRCQEALLSYSAKLKQTHLNLAEHRDAAHAWHRNWSTAVAECRRYDQLVQDSLAANDVESFTTYVQALNQANAHAEECIRIFGSHYDSGVAQREIIAVAAEQTAVSLREAVRGLEEPVSSQGRATDTAGVLTLDPPQLLAAMEPIHEHGQYLSQARKVMVPLATDAVDHIAGDLVRHALNEAITSLDLYLDTCADQLCATALFASMVAELWKQEEWNFAQELAAHTHQIADYLSARHENAAVTSQELAPVGMEMVVEMLAENNPGWHLPETLAKQLLNPLSQAASTAGLVSDVRDSIRGGAPWHVAAASEGGAAALGAAAERVVRRNVTSAGIRTFAHRVLAPKPGTALGRVATPISIATGAWAGAQVAQHSAKALERMLADDSVRRQQLATNTTNQDRPTGQRPESDDPANAR